MIFSFINVCNSKRIKHTLSYERKWSAVNVVRTWKPMMTHLRSYDQYFLFLLIKEKERRGNSRIGESIAFMWSAKSSSSVYHELLLKPMACSWTINAWSDELGWSNFPFIDRMWSQRTLWNAITEDAINYWKENYIINLIFHFPFHF